MNKVSSDVSFIFLTETWRLIEEETDGSDLVATKVGTMNACSFVALIFVVPLCSLSWEYT